MARRRTDRTVFLPWERRGGVLQRLGVGRVRFAVALLVLAVGLVALFHRERHGAAVRSTRARLLVTRRAVDAFRADHNGVCPARGMDELVSAAYLPSIPLDAWGRPLRLVCPSRKDGRGYDLLSDGPDGLPYGLDRVE